MSEEKKQLKYAYFPGCASKATSKEYDLATRAVLEKLGIELVSIPEFSCCGAGVLKDCDNHLNTIINARNFALAERQKLDILTICATCTLNLLQDRKKLEKQKERVKANDRLEEIGVCYEGNVDVKHLLWVLIEDFGLDKLREKIEKPLKNLKIAGFYGCHLLRPFEILRHENEENPDYLEKLIKTLGADPQNIEGKSDCCGFHIVMVRESTSIKMAGKFIKNANENNIDAIITVCPFCQMQFDLYQSKIKKELKMAHLNIPVLHFTQLIGLALNIPAEKLGLNKNIIKVDKILEKLSN